MGLRTTKNNFALLLSLLLLLFANAMFMIESDLFPLLNLTITLITAFFPGGRFRFPGLAVFLSCARISIIYGIKKLNI